MYSSTPASKKLHIWILIICLLLFAALISDTYFIQAKPYPDQIDYTETIKTSDKHRSWLTTIIYTKSGKRILLPEKKDYDFPDSCNLSIYEGMFFRQPVRIDISCGDGIFTYNTGIANRTTGGIVLQIMVVAFICIVSISLIFFKKLQATLLYFAATILFYLIIEALFDINRFLTM